MRNKRLQNQVTAGRFTLPAVTLICTLCWVSTSFLFPQLASIPTQGNQPFFWQSIQSFLLPGWAEQIVSFLIYAIIGYFLIELNNQFGIIRMRASMQTAIYFLFVTVCPEMHLLYAGDIAALASLISIYFLFRSYQQSHAAGYLFYSFLFIGMGSIIFPQLTVFRYFGYLRLIVSNLSPYAVSAGHCSAGCCLTGFCSDTHSSTMRWTCSTVLLSSCQLSEKLSTYRPFSLGNWRYWDICLYCLLSVPFIVSLPGLKIRYAHAPICNS